MYDLIVIDPNVRFGKPCIKGTRISVFDIMQLLSSNMSIDEILIDFPQLTKDSINACFEYFGNKERLLKVAI